MVGQPISKAMNAAGGVASNAGKSLKEMLSKGDGGNRPDTSRFDSKFSNSDAPKPPAKEQMGSIDNKGRPNRPENDGAGTGKGSSKTASISGSDGLPSKDQGVQLGLADHAATLGQHAQNDQFTGVHVNLNSNAD